jgi:hypothetical protein
MAVAHAPPVDRHATKYSWFAPIISRLQREETVRDAKMFPVRSVTFFMWNVFVDLEKAIRNSSEY